MQHCCASEVQCAPCVEGVPEAPDGSSAAHGIGAEKAGVGGADASAGSSAALPHRRRRRFGKTAVVDEAEVPKILSFEGRRDLLRASALSAVLRCAAALLRNNGSCAETYDLSEEVATIDYFISHNWSVGRAKKFFCLALYFNLYAAMLAGLAALTVAAVVGSSGIHVLVYENSDGFLQVPCNARFLTGPAFLAVAVFAGELRHLVCSREWMVFLDKTCIHQTDQETQRLGILKLGAFLRHSSRMVVLYTSVYLHKLWTVYEIACFLSLHPTAHLNVVTIYQPLMVFGGVTINYSMSLVYMLLASFGGGLADLALPVTVVLGYVGVTALLRGWAREKGAIRQRMARFRVEECSCYSEADRPLVQRNIALLMRATGDADEDATESDALAAFNAVVRTRLPRALITSNGLIGIQYLHVVAMMLCSGYATDIVDECLLGEPMRQGVWTIRSRICRAAYHTTTVFASFPLVLVIIAKWCNFCLSLRGFKEVAFVITGAIVGVFAFATCRVLLQLLEHAAVAPGPRRDLFAAGLIVVAPTFTLFTVTVYNRVLLLREEDNLKADGEADDETWNPWEDRILSL